MILEDRFEFGSVGGRGQGIVVARPECSIPRKILPVAESSSRTMWQSLAGLDAGCTEDLEFCHARFHILSVRLMPAVSTYPPYYTFLIVVTRCLTEATCGGRFMQAHGVKVHSPSWWEKAWWQKCETAGHIHPQPESRMRWIPALSSLFFESAQDPGLGDGATYTQDVSTLLSYPPPPI